MLVNSITNFKYDMSRQLTNLKQDAPQPQPQPVKDEGLTASIYFGQRNINTYYTRKNYFYGFYL